MADNLWLKRDLSSDDDVETDFAPSGPVTGFQPIKEIRDMVPTPYSKRSDSREDSGINLSSRSDYDRELVKETGSKGKDNQDSGVIDSFDSTTCSSIEHVDKMPVQCSDADDIEEKFGGLTVTDDHDEAISMTSIRSVDSVDSRVSVPEQESNGDIEIDLYNRDDDGDTMIHVAILTECIEVANVLIDLSPESDCLNIQNCLLQTPLHLAVLTGQSEVVKKLIVKGADVTLRDQQGNTPLHIACRKGDRDAVTELVKSFGDKAAARKKYFAVKNCEGLTCLHVAAQCKQFVILGHLFAKGADVNIGDAKSGRTMLHYAVERKDVETVVLLLTHSDIDVDCRTFKGETPIVLAYWRNYQDIMKRLKTKGAYFSYDIVEDLDDEDNS